MKKIILLLLLAPVVMAVSAQSLSLQLGGNLTPNPYSWVGTTKMALWETASMCYQPKIRKNLELVTGVQISNMNTIITDNSYRECFVGPCPILTVSKVRLQLLEIPIGLNIHLFSLPSQKWEFLLQPMLYTAFLGAVQSTHNRIVSVCSK